MNYTMINEKELKKVRVSAYKRGFLACLVFVVIPSAIAFIIFCNALINL